MSAPLRRRRRRRTAPLLLLAVIAFAAGVVLGAGSSDAKSAAERFAGAWSERDYRAMYRELTPSAQDRTPFVDFRRQYTKAGEMATIRSIALGDTRSAGGGVEEIELRVRTNAFGTVNRALQLPTEGGRINWAPHLVFPGLRPGERLQRRTTQPPRAPILARDGTSLAKGPAGARSSPLGEAAANVSGEIGAPDKQQRRELARAGFPDSVLAGTGGLEKAFNLRLAGTPGGRLLASGRSGTRVLARSAPRKGRPVRTTIDPEVQQSAVSALGSQFGGVAVLDARNGSVLGLAGIGFSSTQPPGSTFKMVTLTAALDANKTRASEKFPVLTSTNVGGREIRNSGGESCGGDLVNSFAHSCNTVFGPIGIRVGAKRLVSTSERFGFNAEPTLFNAQATAAVDPPESQIPRRLPNNLEVGVSAIGQGKVLATPLAMASIAQTFAAGGIRSPTPIVFERDLRSKARPVRVTSKKTAKEVERMMIQVVKVGTGKPAAVPGVEIAGKTGTAELGPGGEGGGQQLDAWFAAYGPVKKPEIVVSVMIVNSSGDGGQVAGPIAKSVFSDVLK